MRSSNCDFDITKDESDDLDGLTLVREVLVVLEEVVVVFEEVVVVLEEEVVPDEKETGGRGPCVFQSLVRVAMRSGNTELLLARKSDLLVQNSCSREQDTNTRWRERERERERKHHLAFPNKFGPRPHQFATNIL